jgi:hypothetical protein
MSSEKKDPGFDPFNPENQVDPELFDENLPPNTYLPDEDPAEREGSAYHTPTASRLTPEERRKAVQGGFHLLSAALRPRDDESDKSKQK